MVQPYLNVVHRFGIQIKPFFIGIYTTRLNGCLNQTVHNNKAWIKSWFNFGLIVTLITIPVSFYLVIQPLIGRLFEIKQNQSYSSLQPIVNVNLNSSQLDYLYLILSLSLLCYFLQLPGVNLPLSELGYYVVALLVSSAFHEFGHFTAAIRYLCINQHFYQLILILTLIVLHCFKEKDFE